MSKLKYTSKTVAADLDPAALAEMKILMKQRERASRLLLKKRRKKAGQ